MTALRLSLAAAFVFPVALSAQTQPPPAQTLDFSGILFANYQYRTDPGPSQSANRFDLERAYLTFRIPAGDRASVRVTTDVFQQTTPGNDSYYRGWTVRAKYAYLQYNYLNGSDWKASARIGLLPTVFIEHDEQFWPRWISPSPTERAGYFASADAGISNTVSIPGRMGEIYASVVNGPGYTSREVDRFKDYSARVTLTPWAKYSHSMLRGLAVSAWGYRGATASKFVDGGQGQAGPIGTALDRDRWGLHIGNLNPRITFGIQYASRREQGELGSNTAASPREVVDSTGTLVSGYALVRPFNPGPAKPHPLSLLARYDRVTVNTDSDARYDAIIGGLIWDLNSRVSASLDYQENNPVNGSPVAPSRIWFAHFVARF
jgi:hypothetical protein